MAVVVTRLLQRLAAVTAGPALALAYDGLPILLLPAWVVAIAAGFTGHWLLLAVAGLLCVHHLSIWRPVWRRRSPRRGCSTRRGLRVLVANVFVDNETPHAAARQLVVSGSDVVVIVESSPSFMAQFDEQGGRAEFPHRVHDPDDTSEYAVTIASACALGPRSRSV